MAFKIADHVEKTEKEVSYERKYNHAPLVPQYKVPAQKTHYDEDADCDLYAASGNYHFKTSIVNGESQAIGFDCFDDALNYIDVVLVRYRVPGIWHVALSLEDNKFYVLPTKTQPPRERK